MEARTEFDHEAMPEAHGQISLTSEEAVSILNLCLLSQGEFDVTAERALTKISTLCRYLLGKSSDFPQPKLDFKHIRIDVLLECLADSVETFKTIAETASSGIFLTDPKGACVYTNEAWQNLADISHDDALGDGWCSAIHPEDKEFVSNKWYSAAQTGRIFTATFRFRTKGGDIRWIYANGAPFRNEEGRLLGYVGTDQNITGILTGAGHLADI